jgi:hypothetical protein
LCVKFWARPPVLVSRLAMAPFIQELFWFSVHETSHAYYHDGSPCTQGCCGGCDLVILDVFFFFPFECLGLRTQLSASGVLSFHFVCSCCFVLRLLSSILPLFSEAHCAAGSGSRARGCGLLGSFALIHAATHRATRTTERMWRFQPFYYEAA